VFYLNLPFGVLATVIIALAYPPAAAPARVRVDWLGAGLLFGGVTALLIALSDATNAILPWFALAATLLASFVVVERRVANPILPLDLFRHRIVTRSLTVVFMTGMAMFGAIAFIPLFVQGVMGGTATQAGQVLTPLFLGWVGTSVAGARLTVRVGYRPVALAGGLLLTSGFVALAALNPDGPLLILLLDVFVLGCGMGFSMLSLLLAVQHGVDRSQLGLATSLNQFFRSVGAAVGVAAMGAILTRSLSGVDLPGGGLPAGEIHLAGLARLEFAHALTRVFVAGGCMSAIGLGASLLLPPVDFTRGVPAGAGEHMIAAEMASLEPDDEPQAVGRT
jgi:Na+/melibiose symporter-like transporter